MQVTDLPFNQHLGLALSEHDGREVVSLKPEPCHLNHVGTVHAGALYSLAEAASGHALLSQTDIRPDEFVAVLRAAKVKYRAPASEQLLAVAEVAEQAVSAAQQQLADKGRAFIDVDVRIVSGDNDVFTGRFSWFVSRNSEP